MAFVSVTQHFNTATPMGRLMLNILICFAQFEREDTIERIRDKVAATKRLGRWCGGTLILGYDVAPGGRRLVVNEKVIHLDVGLASSALRLDLAALEGADDLDLVYEGAIAEQAVGQLLRLIGHGNEEPALWYWSREARSSVAEVDYLGAPTGHVLPIEVKAGTGGAMRSLHVFMADRKLAWAARFNSAAPMVQFIDTTAATGEPVRYSLLSLPAYAVECLPRLAREMDAESRGA